MNSLSIGAGGLLSLACVLSTARAQQFVGFNTSCTPGAVSRGGILAPGAVLGRIDADDYTGWATDPAIPGARVITGIDCIVQDQDPTTPEFFGVALYPEDGAFPGFPDLAAGVFGAFFLPGPLPDPADPGPTAAYSAVAFGAPIVMPAGEDIFIGLSFPATPAWPAEGISFQVVLGYAPTPAFLDFDLPGAALAPMVPALPANSYACYTDFGLVLAYGGRRQLWADIDSPQAGGVVGAMTVQASFPISAAVPGTSSFMSGLHPDVTAPSFNPVRADDVSYMFADAISPFTPVVFLLGFGGFTPEIPLGFILPGSSGVLCMAPVASVPGFTDGAGEASNVTFIPPAARGFLAGMTLVQQAIAITPALTLRGAPCGIQEM